MDACILLSRLLRARFNEAAPLRERMDVTVITPGTGIAVRLQ